MIYEWRIPIEREEKENRNSTGISPVSANRSGSHGIAVSIFVCWFVFPHFDRNVSSRGRSDGMFTQGMTFFKRKTRRETKLPLAAAGDFDCSCSSV